MGAIWTNRSQLIGRTSEIVGYKSGLALNREEFGEIIPEKFHDFWFGEDQQVIRIRSEIYEELISYLLYKVGNTENPSNVSPTILLSRKYSNNPETSKMYSDLIRLFIEFQKKTMNTAKVVNKAVIDPTIFLETAKKKYGIAGAYMGIEIIKAINLRLHKSPWGWTRQVNWKDVAELRGLFESESLETNYGKFFDQRYIDYLSHNFDSMGEINWRKFEALTCEFFEKHGYYVEIGEGRDDDGIDARVWLKESDKPGPATILIQCKRHKTKIEKMVVKSLWADMQEYGAESGLIVTTSSLSPGAEKVCTGRGYPITQANRETLRKWINVMRTPYSGVFLAE
ncbi:MULTISPECIES: restriction endonuclease [Bacillus]|uniref:restriction endonuclease n=2 Tax=Bacillaceae TaxID=186817 RepID=UPI0009D8E946|nr:MULTISPECIES: restriction endonuclease [Bacillus]PEC00888.1 restriction endonuclease [Bacillus cereus]PEC24710.1 restriction endonuclease [Bacillus thuringiensis]PEQ72807.1 restriction endonuclease [Bacillus cereus]PFD40959.1 restriction endonuclease [Bacillus cereus]PFH83365.1 restriction endonuclease [Bacillus cereus]